MAPEPSISTRVVCKSLPTELLDHILNFLHLFNGRDTDIDSLKACSQAFYPSPLVTLVDKRLFESVTVHMGSNAKAVKEPGQTNLGLNGHQLWILLAKKTEQGLDVKEYIRALHIVIHPSAVRRDSGYYSEEYDLAEDRALLLPISLPCLSSLTLSGGRNGYVSWSMIDHEFREAFTRRLSWDGKLGPDNGKRNGVIKRVSIQYVRGFPVDLLEGCPDLNNVLLEGDFIAYPSLSSSYALNLRHLSMHTVRTPSSMLLTWFTSNGIASQLATLDFRFRHDTNSDLFFGILRQCKQTLRELSLDFRGETEVNVAHPGAPAYGKVFLWYESRNPLFVRLHLHTLPALTKIIFHTSIFCDLKQAGGPQKVQQTRTSFLDIAEMLRTRDVPPGISDGQLPHFQSKLKEVELVLNLHMDGDDLPTLADVDFEPLLQSLSSPLSFTTPLLTLNFTNALLRNYRMPFRDILHDIERNEPLQQMVKEGKVRIVNSL